MASAPMKAATTSRSLKIRAKENSIKKRLAETNLKAKNNAQATVTRRARSHKTGKPITAGFTTKSILGEKQGFTPSDYGIGKGAAIPYQIGTATARVTAKVPRPKPKPKAKNPKRILAEGKAKIREDAIKRRMK